MVHTRTNIANKEDTTPVVVKCQNPLKRSKKGRVRQIIFSEMVHLFGVSCQLQTYRHSQSIALNVLVEQFGYGRESQIRGVVGLLC